MPPRHCGDSTNGTRSIKEDVADVMKEVILNDPEYVTLKERMEIAITAIGNLVKTVTEERTAMNSSHLQMKVKIKGLQEVLATLQKEMKQVQDGRGVFQKSCKKISEDRVAVEEACKKMLEQETRVGRPVATKASSSQQQNLDGESGRRRSPTERLSARVDRIETRLSARIDSNEENIKCVSDTSLTSKTTFSKEIFDLKKQLNEQMSQTDEAVQGLRSLQDAVVYEKLQFLRQAILDRTASRWIRPLSADESLNVETAIDAHIIQTRFITCTLHNFRSMLSGFVNTHHVLMAYTPNEWHVRGRQPHLVHDAQAHFSSFHDVAKVFDISEELAPKVLFKLRKEVHSTKDNPVFRMAQLFGSRLFRDEGGVKKCYILPGVPENYKRFLQFGTPSHVHVFKLKSTEFSESSFTDKLSLVLESGDILPPLFPENSDERTYNSDGDEELEEPAGITLHWKRMENSILRDPISVDEASALGWAYISLPIVVVRDPQLVQVLASEFENNSAFLHHLVNGSVE